MAKPVWHGWSKNGDKPDGVALHIGHLPGTKRVVLYMRKGCVLTPMAYFKTEKLAAKAMELMDILMGVK